MATTLQLAPSVRLSASVAPAACGLVGWCGFGGSVAQAAAEGSLRAGSVVVGRSARRVINRGLAVAHLSGSCEQMTMLFVDPHPVIHNRRPPKCRPIASAKR